MRIVFLACLVSTTLAACTTATPTDTADSDTDVVSTTDGTPADTDVADTDTGVADTDVIPPYEGGQYKVTQLRVVASGYGRDLTGDGLADNKVADLLTQMDLIFGPGIYNIPTVNARIDAMLLAERAIVLLDVDVDVDGAVVTFDALRGGRDLAYNLIVLPESYDDQGTPLSRMAGEPTDPDSFEVGPSPLAIPVQFYSNEPVILIAAEQAYVTADALTGALEGKIAAAVTSKAIMDGVVIPLIESEFGLDSTYGAQLLVAAQALVDLSADLDLQGEPALSSAFTFEAIDATWVR